MAEKKRKRDDEPTEREAEPAAEASKPTMGAILEEVVAKNRKHASALDLFEQNCQSYGWEGDEEYFETGVWYPLGGSAYCSTHGAEEIGGNIRHFLGYFLPRKCCTPSQSEMKRICAALRALVKHCAAKGYLDAAETKPLLKEISVSSNFQAEAIADGLNGLARSKYWDQFEEDDDEEVELCRIDVCQYKEEGEDPEDPDVWERCRERKRAQCYSTTVSDELPLEIEKVRKDGWVFRKPYEPGHGYDSDDEHESTYWDALTHRSLPLPELFVRLPEDVAKLGKVSASISCMKLALRRGVWRPIPFDDYCDIVAGNVYPPTD